MQSPIVDRARNTELARRRMPVRAMGTGFGQHLQAESPASTETAAELMPAQGLDALLSVQEVDVDSEPVRRRAAVEYGFDLLDRLDQLHTDVLADRVPAERLANLAEKLRSDRRRCREAELEELIDYIELRARVELTKFSAVIRID